MIVQDIMTSKVTTIQSSASVSEAANILQDLSIRHLPVLEGSVLAGILSDRDLKQIYLAGLQVGDASTAEERFEAPVASIMTPDVVSTHPEADLAEVVDALLENRVGALPVVDPSSGDLLGIVSYVDVLRATRDEL